MFKENTSCIHSLNQSFQKKFLLLLLRQVKHTPSNFEEFSEGIGVTSVSFTPTNAFFIFMFKKVAWIVDSLLLIRYEIQNTQRIH
jgi:hypothetical protein